MMEDRNLPKSYKTFEQQMLQKPFKPSSSVMEKAHEFHDLLKKSFKPSVERYGRTVPGVKYSRGMSLEEASRQARAGLMSDIGRFAAATRLLRRANPWLSAADIAAQLLQEYNESAWYSGPAVFDPAGWTRCPKPDASCETLHPPTHYGVVSGVADCQFALPCSVVSAPVEAMMKIGTTWNVTGQDLYMSAYKPVDADTAWHVGDYLHPGVPAPLAPWVKGATIQVPRDLDETEPETVPAELPLENALKAAIKAATGSLVDNDGKVLGRPSVRVAVRLKGATLVPHWPSGTVTFVSPRTATKTSSSRPRLPPPKPEIVTHSKAPDRKKKSAPMAAAKAIQAYHVATELGDAVDVLADAIPGKPCKKLPGVQKALCVLEHAGEISWGLELFEAFIYNQLEDKLVAAVNRLGMGTPRGAGYHGPSGMQMGQALRMLKQYAPRGDSEFLGVSSKDIKEFLNARPEQMKDY